MSTENAKLKTPVEPFVMPCPFCGGEVELNFKFGDWGYTSDTVSIRCEPCGIGFVENAEEWTPGVGTYSIREEAETRVLSKWNTRSA